MRFVTFRGRDGADARAGVLLGDGQGERDTVVDLAHESMGPALGGLAPDLTVFIAAGLAKVCRAVVEHGLREEARRPLGALALLAPLPNPRRIYGIAHNYTDALAERGMAHPSEPVLFMKEGSTVIGPGEPIILPAGIGGVTYEAEIAAIIGSLADRVGPAGALSHVAGYTVFNDISASELIRREGRFDRGKNLPTFGPMGPYLASADEIANPHTLKVRLDVDGQVLQNGTTATMLFDIAALIAFLSARQPLEPGDVIATGTPAGVAPVQRPPTWLRPGTTVRAEVEGLGMLSNPIVEGASIDD